MNKNGEFNMKKTQLISNAILLQKARIDSVESTDLVCQFNESRKLLILYIYLAKHLSKHN